MWLRGHIQHTAGIYAFDSSSSKCRMGNSPGEVAFIPLLLINSRKLAAFEMLDSSAFLQKGRMDLFSFFLSDMVSSFTYEKLETMPVEDAGEREEKQRDEPSQLSSL